MSRKGSDRINGDRINGLFHLLIHGVFLGVKSPTDPITIDPNFQRDIQVNIGGIPLSASTSQLASKHQGLQLQTPNHPKRLEAEDIQKRRENGVFP